MIHFLNLVLLFAFALQSAFALECYLNGECTDSNYVGAQRAKDMNQCISICQDTSKCNWSTFVPDLEDCIMFSDCNTLSSDNCKECKTNEKGCQKIQCHADGICQVSSKLEFHFMVLFAKLKSFFTIKGDLLEAKYSTTFDACGYMCKAFAQNCHWFSYEKKSSNCFMFKTCDKIEANSEFTTGSIECDFPSPSTPKS